MSDTENQVQDQEQEESIETVALNSLKTKARTLGISFHPSISAENLSARIKEFLAAQEAGKDVAETPVALEKTAETAPLSAAGKIKAMRDEALKLIRVNIVCMNPAKKEWDGEIITIANRNLPTQKKFVPFNTPDGYHIPKIMYDMLVARECPTFYNERVKTASGFQMARRMRRIKEFAIEVLPQLTEAELRELARQQAMAAGQE